jgi:hypothetical protein
MGFVEDEVRAFNKYARGGPNLWTPYAKPREFDEQLSLRLHCIEDAFGGGRIVAADIGINLYQIFPRVPGPDKINWQELDPLR